MAFNYEEYLKQINELVRGGNEQQRALIQAGLQNADNQTQKDFRTYQEEAADMRADGHNPGTFEEWQQWHKKRLAGLQGQQGKSFSSKDSNTPVIRKTGKDTYTIVSDSKKGSDCFITTAVCRTLQKPDDCVQLAKFRDFRDTFMQETPEMQAEVQEYYEIAPRICAAIDFSGEKTARERYASIWQESLKPAFEALDAGDNQKAHDLYKDMVLGLKTEFISG